MKFLVIGLGSMGRRRIRNLKELGHENIAGFDLREDRLEESKCKYSIETYSDFTFALNDFHPDAIIISTSPKYHMDYAIPAVEKGIHCFIEASVVDADRILELSNRCEELDILVAPSCTMRYFPGPLKIKELLKEGVIGKPLNINYQTGQYLPDWHPWEDITDYYVSDRETGGGREIVPFELTWLNDVFGEPEPLACVKSKLTDMQADIDDIYHCLMRYPGNVLANITVEVISRPHATRYLRVLGSDGELVYDSDENCVRVSTSSSPEWRNFHLGSGTVENGYINPEEPYIAEMRDFIMAIKGKDKALYPNTLKDDYQVLQALYKLEELSENN